MIFKSSTNKASKAFKLRALLLYELNVILISSFHQNRRGKRRVTRMIVAVVLGKKPDSLFPFAAFSSPLSCFRRNSFRNLLAADSNCAGFKIPRSLLSNEVFHRRTNFSTRAGLLVELHQSTPVRVLIRKFPKSFSQGGWIIDMN